MKFIRKTIIILTELVAFILFTLWYSKSHSIEPFIGMITTAGALLVSVITKITIRPKLVMHKITVGYGRRPMGYTQNNPRIIRVGIDMPNQYWELDWDFELEIRNNSSEVAYNIKFNYKNIPLNTTVKGSIGKIEPLLSHETRRFRFRMLQFTNGNHEEADAYLRDNIKELTKHFEIEAIYTDETEVKFRTIYNWSDDTNKFYIF